MAADNASEVQALGDLWTRAQPAPVQPPKPVAPKAAPAALSWLEQTHPIPVVEHVEQHYLPDLKEAEVGAAKGIAAGESPLASPVKNLWELVETPVQGLAHGATSLVGWAAGLVSQAGVSTLHQVAPSLAPDVSFPKQVEQGAANLIPAPHPATMGGRAWNVFGMLFAPATSLVQAGEETYDASTPTPSPWAHYGFEAVSGGIQLFGGKALGEATGLLRGAKGEPVKPADFSTRREASADVRTPKRPGQEKAADEPNAVPPKSDLFETDEDQQADVLGRRSDQLQSRRENQGAPEDERSFAEWFRGSHAHDEQGKPLTLYHGTNADFEEFEPNKPTVFDYGKGNGAGSEAIWFSKDPAYASAYTDARIPGSNVRPVHIQMRHPFHAPETFTLKDQEAMVSRAKAEGYDGVVFPNGEYAVFRPEQVRSIFKPDRLEEVSGEQAASILDYQKTLHDAAQARQDAIDFEHASTSAERVDDVLRGGGPGHAGMPPGQYDSGWHRSLRTLAALSGFDIENMRLSMEPSDASALAAEFERNPEGVTSASPKQAAWLAELRADATFRAQFAALKRKTALGLKRIFPQTTGNDAEAHIAHVSGTMALNQMERERAAVVNTGLRRLFARMKKEDQLSFWRFYQKGEPMPAHLGDVAHWDSIKRFYKELFDRNLQERQLAGEPIEPMRRAEYFPQYAKPKNWTERERVGQSERGRAFDTMDNLIDAGVKPLSLNPAVHVEYFLRGTERAMGKAEFNWQKRFGGLRMVQKGYVPKPHEDTFEGPDGFWYAGDAHLMNYLQNTVLAKPAMGAEGVALNVLKGFGILKNSVQSIAFGLNVFHGAHIGGFVRPNHALAESLSLIDHPVSPSGVVDTAKAFVKMFTTGDRPLVQGEKISARHARRIATGREGGIRYNPKTRAVEFPEGGDPFLDVIDVVRHGADPSILTTKGQEALRRMAVGGFEPHNPEWTNLAWAKAREHIAENTAAGYMRAAGWAVPTMLRAIGYPMMDQFVPLMKMRAYLADSERWYSANPGVEPGSPAERVALTRLRRENDQRYGEMNTKMLGWNRWMSAAFQGSMLSFGWNFGLMSQFGGGAKDAARAFYDTARGAERQKMRSRALYAALYTGYACAAGALVQKIFSGKDPETLKDCIYPIVAIDKAGKAIRVKLPSLMNDFGAEYYNTRDRGILGGTAQTLSNKSAPIWSMIHEMWTNEDWMGRPISDPFAPAVQQAAQKFKAVMHDEMPWSVAEALRPVPNVTPTQEKNFRVAAALGIDRAPEYVTTPPPIEQIYRVAALGGNSETYLNTVQYEAERQAGLKGLYEQGKKDGNYGPFNIALNQFAVRWNTLHPDSPVSRRSLQMLAKRMDAPTAAFTLRNLQDEAQEHVWTSMQDYGDNMTLLAQYVPYFHKAVLDFMYGKMTPEQRQALDRAFRATARPTPAASAPAD